MFLEFKNLENELLIDNQRSYSTNFDSLMEVSKIMAFNIIFKFIKIENIKIESLVNIRIKFHTKFRYQCIFLSPEIQFC